MIAALSSPAYFQPCLERHLLCGLIKSTKYRLSPRISDQLCKGTYLLYRLGAKFLLIDSSET